MTVQNTPDTNPGYYKNRAHECIEFAQYLNFNLGNAFKYIWRHREKNGREDLEKALWYLERQRDDAPEFRKLKGKEYCEMRNKLCLTDFDIDTHTALGAILSAAADYYAENNIIWAIACVKDLMKKMPSESPMPSENTPNPERK